MDIADKLVLKLLQYAGNYAGELLQQAKISHRFGSDDVSVGRYQRSGNSAALFASFLKTGSLFLHVFVSFRPYSPKKHRSDILGCVIPEDCWPPRGVSLPQ